ncbi:MAG: PAS domain-containing protein [Chloroflexi bacterium]|nr:PAS domain-containing protein [Chloroflexota bacterium]
MMINPLVAEKTDSPAQFFTHLWQSMSSGTLVINDAGVITSANQTAATMLATSVVELVGGYLHDFWPEQLLPLELPDDVEIHRETVLRRRDGRALPVALTITPIAAETGAHKLIAIASLQDVQRLNESLTHTQRLAGMGTLTASIAHELNNPISIITTACANLNLDVDDNALSLDRLRHYVEMIEQSAWRCVRIVEVLRNYSLDGLPQIAVTVWNKIVEDSLTLVKQQFQGQFNVHIETDLAPNMKSIVCDHHRLTQVVINLLTNARDAMQPDGGVIQVKTWFIPAGAPLPGPTVYPLELATTDYVALSVRDSGVGIHADVLDRIFDPFFTTKTNGSGTGLGLFIARRIVEQHDGHLWAENNPDKGATFTVLLPRM